jgi:hypothetical protein
MRAYLIATLIAALALAPPAGAQDAPDSVDPGAPPPAADAAPPADGTSPPDKVYGDIGEPRSAPPAGPASSLGGSGATGPDSVGTLPERDTDFGRNTWRNTPFALVLELMEALPDRIDSAAEHGLARNLLVSIGDAPPGDDGGSRLLEIRVRKLLALGNVADAAALARAAPGIPQSAALAHDEVEAELLGGQIEAACIDLRAFAGILTDPGSAGALLLCRRNDGDAPADDATPVDLETLGPAARIAGAPLPADPASAAPARLVAAAGDPKLPPEQRLEAAFAAGRASAMLGETLADMFQAAPFVPGLTADGPAPADGATAAGLYHAIESEDATGVKLALAGRGLLSPENIADKISVAMAVPLRNLQPVPELGKLAADFAALFYTLGDVEAATPWAELADQSGGSAALWPYRVLLKQADAVGIADWEQQAKLPPAFAARILTILSAFGVTAPPSDPAAGEDRPEAPLADLLAMDQSARDSHIGETTLRALAMLGRDGPAHAHPLTLRRVLADLDQVRLHSEARALAFEAITATLAEARRGAGP